MLRCGCVVNSCVSVTVKDACINSNRWRGRAAVLALQLLCLATAYRACINVFLIVLSVLLYRPLAICVGPRLKGKKTIETGSLRTVNAVRLRCYCTSD